MGYEDKNDGTMSADKIGSLLERGPLSSHKGTLSSQQYREKFQDMYTRFFNHSSSDEASSEDETTGEKRTQQQLQQQQQQKQWNGASSGGNGETTDLSRQLHDLISSNSELGSRLLSLLLVSSGNAKDIICAVNKGDLEGLKKLDLQKSQASGRPLATAGASSPSDGRTQRRYTEEELSEFRKVELEKRRKNTEASARFRVRKKQQQREKAERLKQLNSQISELYSTIENLLDENRFWKGKLEEVNERKSREMLDKIKGRRLKEEDDAATL
ncbi:LAME_0F08702g1_1 [Lachancea meyersii CBS 8951]|uniref:LAME_0F08702g1_1 n=1 Tax=Lachancea meyersii CBS 8951 TaxID=1266667 RepID=A0A1G4JUY9_9SACH|nr:LAME_0F08702g1_1 [Lachancea meyersii CBS 8951]